MHNEAINVTGKVDIQLFDKAGNLKDTRSIKNLVVTVGKAFIAASMIKTTTNSPAAMTHMAVGTNSTAAAAGDSTLGTEVSRVALTTPTASGAVVTYVATFPAGSATGALTEAGIFNASTAGTMQCRTVFPVVNKGVDDGMSITWQVTVS